VKASSAFGEGLCADEVSSVIRSHLSNVRDCYDEILKRHPDISGRVVVGFSINSGGRSEQIRFPDRTIDDRAFLRCLAGVFRKMSFPPPRGGKPVNVRYPFVFNQPGNGTSETLPAFGEYPEDPVNFESLTRQQQGLLTQLAQSIVPRLCTPQVVNSCSTTEAGCAEIALYTLTEPSYLFQSPLNILVYMPEQLSQSERRNWYTFMLNRWG